MRYLEVSIAHTLSWSVDILANAFEEIQMHRLRVRIYVPRVVTVKVAYLNVLQEGMETFQAPVVLTSALLDVIVTI